MHVTTAYHSAGWYDYDSTLTYGIMMALKTYGLTDSFFFRFLSQSWVDGWLRRAYNRIKSGVDRDHTICRRIRVFGFHDPGRFRRGKVTNIGRWL